MKNDAILEEEKTTHKISEFVHHVMDDMGAAERIRMTFLGSQLGLYKAMAYAGPMTVGEVARRTGSSIKLVKHWVDALAADNYLVHEPETDTFCLPDEHAIALTDPASPFYIGNYFLNGSGKSMGKVKAAAPEHAVANAYIPSLDVSKRFFSEEYITSLFKNWFPSVEGLTERLQTGILVADMGCGRHGASTLVMAQAFPNSTFLGFDRYPSSVERAHLLAKEMHIRNAFFELATAERVYERQYDLITLIECMRHISKDTEGLLRECYEVLKPNGILVVAEAKDSSKISEEQYQRLRSYKAMPVVADHVSRVEIGIDGKERALQETALRVGFTIFRKVAETLYDKVYEMRP